MIPSSSSDLSVASRGCREGMKSAAISVAGPRLWASFCSGLLPLRIKDYYEKKDLRLLFSRTSTDPQRHYIYINDDRRDGVLCNETDAVIFEPDGTSIDTMSSFSKMEPSSIELDRYFVTTWKNL